MGRIWSNGGGIPINASNLNGLETDVARAKTIRWTPSTAYNAGDTVLNPSGDLVTANASHTSGSSYTAANWTRNSVNKGDLVLNVRDYGAKGDGQTTASGSITSGTNALTASGFSATDVGKVITVAGAGASGAVLITTISGYTSSTQVTLTASASTTVSSATVSWGTDDTTAIQNAVTAAAGGTVYFPAGLYLATSVATSGATLFTFGATLRKVANGTFLTASGTAAHVNGLTIDGNGCTGVCVYATGADVIVENNYITNTDPAAYSLQGTNSATGLIVRNNRVNGVVVSTNADNVAFLGNKIVVPSTRTNTAGGIGLGADTSSSNHQNGARVLNNYIEVGGNTFGIGIVCRQSAVSNEWVISGNTIIATANCYGGMTIDTVGPGTISGNTFRVQAGTPSTGAIEVVQSTGVTLAGNALDGGGVVSTIVSVNRSSDTLLSGNVFSNPGTAFPNACITIQAPLTGNVTSRTTVVGNKFLNLASSAGGIRLFGNAASAVIDGTLIEGNHIYGNTTGASGIIIDVESTSTISNTAINGNLFHTLANGIRFFNTPTGVTVSGNRAVNVTTRYTTGGTAPAVLQDANDWQWGTAAPTAQYHFVGERVLNSAPAVGSPTGWVCTAAGTPGTWAALANL